VTSRAVCSIDQLCDVMRHAIESAEKILYELRLDNTEFTVNEVCQSPLIPLISLLTYRYTRCVHKVKNKRCNYYLPPVVYVCVYTCLHSVQLSVPASFVLSAASRNDVIT